MTLTALAWRGGKSAGPGNTTGTGAWVASLLPSDTDVFYCEPCFGMGGVLLQRPKAGAEMVNDLDGRLMNWWRVVRDQPAELARLLRYTPCAREAYEEARQTLDCADPVRRALAFTVLLQQAHPARRTPDESLSRAGGWYAAVDPARAGQRQPLAIERLAERLRDVALENTDALAVLARTAKRDDAVVYVDPPYAGTAGYAHEVDREALALVLQAQRGRVALSGYGDEWDALGWRRESRAVVASATHAMESTDATRTESLWMNYAPAQQRLVLE